MLGNGYASSPASRRRRGRPRGGGGSGYGFWQPQSLHQHQQQEISPVVPPCTEFDMAYFRAYSHIGVHEEMLKVTFISILFRLFNVLIVVLL
ncbi:hypothetical protein GW17_00036623 [Ensete ventricosum]|uniref:Uncharacterized protein n=1 Tax=Ensete ventricosum TaxID=4639 RepID=A0A444DR35_ENSVE|nr:hypothetical protein B296_00036977 [Ensete ventricosum]RWW00416.1 hypothetical protein GW17_00036623 [Ensete ventricosum]